MLRVRRQVGATKPRPPNVAMVFLLDRQLRYVLYGFNMVLLCRRYCVVGVVRQRLVGVLPLHELD